MRKMLFALGLLVILTGASSAQSPASRLLVRPSCGPAGCGETRSVAEPVSRVVGAVRQVTSPRVKAGPVRRVVEIVRRRTLMR